MAFEASTPASERLLGQGIYDVAEIARLVRRSPTEVSGWASGDRPLLLPRHRRLFSFYDLVTALVTAELRRRQVSLIEVRAAREWVGRRIDAPWPLAHAAGLDRLASVGKSVFYRDEGDDWLDVGRHGQHAFQEVVDPLIRHLSFDDLGMASSWRPVEGVIVDPAVQAGAPCVDGTRIPTSMLAELVAAGDDPDDIADDYALDVELVSQAVRYETDLAA